MGKARRRRRRRSAPSDVAADEVAARAAELHAALVGVIDSYHELAARYERLVASVDASLRHLRAVDDAMREVHQRLGLRDVPWALEAPTRHLEAIGLDPFVPGRGGPATGASELAELRARSDGQANDIDGSERSR